MVRRFGVIAGRRLLGSIATMLAAIVLASGLVRLAPGFGIDERQYDLRLSEQTLEAMRRDAAAANSGWLAGCTRYISGLFRGEWGYSLSLRRPVRDLIAERGALTVGALGAGLGSAWFAAAAVAASLLRFHRRELEAVVSIATGLLLSLPAAVVALLFLYMGGGPAAALAVILFPRILQYARHILDAACRRPHVLAALARGGAGFPLVFRHVFWPAAPELVALAGVSVSLAIGAVIPVEALCDSPGIGQLVWQAAMARDLPVLLHMTLLVTAVTCAANLLADAARLAISVER